MSPKGPVPSLGKSTSGDPLSLVERMVESASNRSLVASVSERVARFRVAPEAERRLKLPGLFLLLEHYLTQIDPARLRSEDLRRAVQEEFSDLLKDRRFGLIFAEEIEQEIQLSREFLKPLLDRALELLGPSSHPVLEAVAVWLRRLDEQDAAALGPPGTEAEGWTALLARLGHDLYQQLAELLGEGVARELFERQFMEIAEDYLGLTTFAAVVRLFPPAILDERKLSLLSRSQTRQVLLERLAELQTVNQQLEESNADLQMALEVLERSNEELELRVAERTLAWERANEEVFASEERLRRISEAAQVGILMVDPRGRCSFMNEALEETLGFDRSELLGRPILGAVVPRRFRARFFASFRQALKTGDGPGLGAPWEMVAQRKDGTEFPAEISMSSVKHVGRWHLVAVVRDVTERKREEEERRRLAEQLQEAQRLESLGVLTGGIAHDFNNLLTAILGHAGLMEELVPEDFPLRSSIREIRKAGQRLADITQQLHAYSGSGRFVLEPVRIGDLVAEMAELLSTSVSKRAELDFRFQHHLPAVMVDRGQLQQVVINLITNASEALGEGDGEVRLRAEEVYLGRERLDALRHHADLEPGPYVMIEVTDTGSGMDPETESKIFEPFFSTRFAGRGLGLPAVLGIVRGHHGGIEVETQVGAGTTVRIFLPPLASDDHSGTHEVELPESGPTTGRILVVDDEEPVRILARRVLEEYGFEVMLAENGVEAVKIFRLLGQDVDLVLLDLTMPHMDGAQTLVELRRLVPEVKVLLSSGYSRHETMRRFSGQEVSGFVAKPYEVRELIWEVRRALANVTE